MKKGIQNSSNIRYTSSERFAKWIDLANSFGEENRVENIRNLAARYLTYYFPSDQKATNELIVILKPIIGSSLVEHCLKNRSMSIGLCLEEVVEVRGILLFCANWNKSMGDLSPNNLDSSDLVNTPLTISPEQILFESIQNINTQNRFEYNSNLNIRIRFEDNNFHLKPEISGFIRLLDKENIDIRLIRFCKHCNNIFWLRRGNQKTCSRKCTNAAGSAKWRQKHN